MKKIISLCLICLMLTACGNKYTLIDYNKAISLLSDNNTVIIDVREAGEYNEGHINGSINIPLSSINSISYSKDTPIILYCATGVRSSEAALTLSKMGYTNLYNLDGGIINWGEELISNNLGE